MAVLLDTSVLGRLANRDDPDFHVASSALGELHRRSEALYVAAQSFVEFRNFATRPAAVNGLGLSVAEAAQEALTFETLFLLLPDTPDIYPAWKSLARASMAMGKQVHDVRLVAACQVHGIAGILTFNVQHFVRLAAFVPGFTVLDPGNLAASLP